MSEETKLALLSNDLKHHTASLGRVQDKLSTQDDRIRDLEEMEHEFVKFQDVVHGKFRDVNTAIDKINDEAGENKEEIKAAKMWIKIVKSAGGIFFVVLFYVVSNIADVNNFLEGIKTMRDSGDQHGN